MSFLDDLNALLRGAPSPTGAGGAAAPSLADTPPSFAQQLIQTALWLTADDFLAVDIVNTAANISIRWAGQRLRETGSTTQFEQILRPTADRVQNLFTLSPMRGWLTNTSLTVTNGVVRRGDCYVVLSVYRGDPGFRFRTATLSAAYLTNTFSIAWPPAFIEHESEGTGVLVVQTPANPGDGNNLTVTTPNNVRWRLRSLQTTFTNTAFNGALMALCQLKRGTTVLSTIVFPVGVAKGQNRLLILSDAVYQTVAAGVRVVAPSPRDMFLQSNDAVVLLPSTTTTGFSFTSTTMVFEETKEI